MNTSLLSDVDLMPHTDGAVDACGSDADPCLAGQPSDALAVHPFLAWPSVRQFHNVRSNLLRKDQHLAHFRGKVKLHGANAALRISALGVSAQSRNGCITPSQDPFWMLDWVAQHSAQWAAFGARIGNDPITLFGEWCGAEVQAKVALTHIGQRIFAVFALEHQGQLVLEPDTIRMHLNGLQDVPGLHVLPWQTDVLTIDLMGGETADAAIARMNALVDGIEAEDPWVLATFGVSGRGEGLVCFETDADGMAVPSSLDRLVFHAFKAKGASHRVIHQANAVLSIPQVATGAPAFVAMTTPDARMEQGLAALGGVATLAKTGAFIAWVQGDVRAECFAEMEAANLVWSDITRLLAARSRAWWMAQIAATQ